jgi:hypothetical protein
VELAIDNEVDGERTGAVDRLTGGGKIVGDGGTMDTSGWPTGGPVMGVWSMWH